MRLLLFNLATDADDPILGFTTRWIGALAERVEFIHVITMRVGRLVVPGNVRVYSVGKEKGYSKPRRVLEFYRHLLRILREEQIDVCFSHMIPTFAVLAAPLLKPKGIPIVTWYSHPYIGWIARLGMRLSSRVVTAAPEVSNAITDRCILTGHGVDLSSFPLPKEDKSDERKEKVILTVGRISPIKDYETLIDAMHLLQQDEPRSFSLWIIGAAPERDRLYFDKIRARVDEGNLRDRVRFLGAMSQDRLPFYMHQADVFVNMQAGGGVGKAVLEAMASGLPTVLSTSIFNEELGKWENNIIFRAGDAADLAAKIRNVLELPEHQRHHLIRLVRGIAEGHSLEHLINVLLTIFIETEREGKTLRGVSV